MKAALLIAPFTLDIREIDKPKPKPEEVLIKMKTTGICGSDLHAYRGTHPFRKPPVVLGHELAGEVEQVGMRVKTIEVGDVVTVEPWIYCGKCPYCLEERYNLCVDKRGMGTSEWQGSFAEYVVAPEDTVCKLPEGMSYEEGALIEPLAVGVHIVQEAKLNLGESVVIFGAGTIGLATLSCLIVAGITRIIVTDVEDFNLKLASQIGATHIVNIRKESLGKVVNEVTGGKGVDLAIVAAGVESLVGDATKVIRGRGRVIVPAIFSEYVKVDMFPVMCGEKHIQGAMTYTGKNFATAINLLALSKISIKPLITHRIPLDGAGRAFNILDKKKEKVIKILFTF